MAAPVEVPKTDSDGRAVDPPVPPKDKGLRSRAVRASAWALSGHWVGMPVRMARSMVLTRLLYPGAFGLMTMVNVVLNGLQMVSDVGVSVSIVQHPDGEDEDFLRTAWTLNILRGIALWLVCCILAWPVAEFYAEPMLLWLVPAAGFNIVIMSCRSTNLSVLRRNLQLRSLSLFTYAMEIAELGIILGLAYATRSVWALVVGSLVTSTVYTLASHIVLPGIRHRPAWNKKVAASLIHFGKWVLVSSLLTFLARQGDRLLLGKLIDVNVLGVYSTALVLALLPRDVLTGLSDSVLFPAIAEKARLDPGSVDRHVATARSLLLRLALIGVAGVAIGGPLAFRTFYDLRYQAAGEMAIFLAIPTWFGILQASSGTVLLALGDSRSLTLVQAVTFASTWIFAVLGHFLAGLPGFIVGLGAAQCAGELLTLRLLARKGVHIGRQDLVFTVLAASLAGSGVAAIGLMRTRLPDVAPWMIDLAVSAVWLGPLGAWMGLKAWREVRRR